MEQIYQHFQLCMTSFVPITWFALAIDVPTNQSLSTLLNCLTLNLTIYSYS